MKILARDLTADLYNCKSSTLGDKDFIQSNVRAVLDSNGYTALSDTSDRISENQFALLVLLPEGHVNIHVYAKLRYVAIDIFLCKPEAEPEQIYREIRNLFKPDKTKTTFLKRGDFGNNTDVKPKIKTRVAPLRKIHNTGAKVIRILARRNQT